MGSAPELIDLTESDDEDQHQDYYQQRDEFHLSFSSTPSAVQSPPSPSPSLIMPVLSPVSSAPFSDNNDVEDVAEAALNVDSDHDHDEEMVGDGLPMPLLLLKVEPSEPQINSQPGRPQICNFNIPIDLSSSFIPNNNDVNYTTAVNEDHASLLPPFPYTPQTPPTPRNANGRMARTPKTALTEEQTAILQSSFQECQKLNVISTLELVGKTGLAKEKIQQWFRYQVKIQKKNPRNMPPAANNRNNDNNDVQRSQPQPEENTPRKRPCYAPTEPTAHSSRNGQPQHIPTATSQRRTTPHEQQSLIARKMGVIPSFTTSVILGKLIELEPRVNNIVRIYMKKKWELKKSLQTETNRIREMRISSSPFTQEQNNAIEEWRKFVFDKMVQKRLHSQDTCDALRSIEESIIKVWLPIMVYSKLHNEKLEVGIRDFTYNSRNRSVSSPKLKYYMPSIIRIIDRKLKTSA